MILTTLGRIEDYPPDSILGLSAKVEADNRNDKIDATIGVIKDDTGKVFIPQTVRHVWKEVEIEPSNYLSPKQPYEWLGDYNFIKGSINLVFDKSLGSNPQNISAIGTIGGTGAIYSFLMTHIKIHPKATILISQPSWPNHQSIANYLGYQVKTYNHLFKGSEYNFEEHLLTIKKLPKNSVVVLHAGLGHNPTGVNPSIDQLKELARNMEDKIALFDCAYLGLGDNFENDSFGFNHFLSQNIATAVCVSFAKNAGLYNQRPGLLLIPQQNQKTALKLQRMLNALARLVYSSPPAQGEKIIGKILSDKTLTDKWLEEVKKTNQILLNRRQLFATYCPKFNFIENQRGLFSILPLNLAQIEKLKTEFGIYVTESGRINIAGVAKNQLKTFANILKDI